MKATDFTRDDCLIGKKRHAYTELTGSWRCNECGGKLVMKWDERFPEDWGVMCAKCDGVDFVHVYELERQQWQAEEVLPALAKYLPPELRPEKRHRPHIELNPEPLEL